MTRLSIPSGQNVAGPGAVRLALALIVVIGHFSRFNIGPAAVYVFFFLSGYWIETMWERKYRYARLPILTFLISRVWRLLPIFLVCSAAALLVEYCLPGSDQPMFSPWVLLPSVVIVGYNSLQIRPLLPAWSLDIEVQFYLLAAFLSWSLRRSKVLTIVSAIVLCYVTTNYLEQRLVFTFLPFFILGMLAAMHSISASRTQAMRAGQILVAFIACLALSRSSWQILLSSPTPAELYLTLNPWVQVGTAIVALPIALWSTGQISNRIDHACGDLSYIVYLVHSVALAALEKLLPSYPTAHFGPRAVIAGFTFALIGAISYLLWKCIDMPLNRIRAQYVKRQVARGKEPIMPGMHLYHDLSQITESIDP